jgi:hypothetical protein
MLHQPHLLDKTPVILRRRTAGEEPKEIRNHVARTYRRGRKSKAPIAGCPLVRAIARSSCDLREMRFRHLALCWIGEGRSLARKIYFADHQELASPLERLAPRALGRLSFL